MALLCDRTEKRQPCSAQQGLATILSFFNMLYNDLKYKKMSQVPVNIKNLQYGNILDLSLEERQNKLPLQSYRG